MNAPALHAIHTLARPEVPPLPPYNAGLSSEAVRELGLEPGSVAVAVVKSTSVIVETP